MEWGTFLQAVLNVAVVAALWIFVSAWVALVVIAVWVVVLALLLANAWRQIRREEAAEK